MKLHSVTIACVAVAFAISSTRILECEAGGFTIDLIHRDSLQSPILDSSPTHSERITNVLRRSFARLKRLKKSHFSHFALAEIVADNGEYLIEISIGTPPVKTLAIADTGSDLMWVQCKPWIQCFDQNAPLFEPELSSSYRPIPCTSNKCNSLSRTSCDGSNGNCRYTIAYGDRSFSKGDLAMETITLSSKASENVSFDNVIMGCGHLDRGTFGTTTSGIVGLGGGKVSLISQMASSIKGKFSYCLLPFPNEASSHSKMNFGDNALVTGDSVVSIRIIQDSPDTFYFLTLEGVTVGDKRLDLYDFSPFCPFSPIDGFGDGNIIIDSGTTLTFLPTELYEQVEAAVRRQIEAKEVKDPQGMLSLCYLYNDMEEVPKIIFHFKGANVELKPVNTFVQTGKNTLCLAFAPSSNLAIYGNLAQINFLVGYDLEKKTVSFKPTDCSKE